MKACKSKDGKMRYTIAIKYRIGRDVLIEAVAGQFYSAELNLADHQKPTTRKAVWEIARHYVRGYSPENENITETAYDAAVETIDRLFPELREP